VLRFHSLKEYGDCSQINRRAVICQKGTREQGAALMLSMLHIGHSSSCHCGESCVNAISTTKSKHY